MRPVIIRGQLAACRKVLAIAGSMFSQRQLVDCWDGATPLNPGQIALTDRPVYWMGSALVLSVEDVMELGFPMPKMPSRVVMRAAERLMFGLVPLRPVAEAGRLMKVARVLSGEGR